MMQTSDMGVCAATGPQGPEAETLRRFSVPRHGWTSPAIRGFVLAIRVQGITVIVACRTAALEGWGRSWALDLRMVSGKRHPTDKPPPGLSAHLADDPAASTWCLIPCRHVFPQAQA